MQISSGGEIGLNGGYNLTRGIEGNIRILVSCLLGFTGISRFDRPGGEHVEVFIGDIVDAPVGRESPLKKNDVVSFYNRHSQPDQPALERFFRGLLGM